MQFPYILLTLLWPFYQFSELPLNLPVRIYALDLLSLVCFVIFLFRLRQSHPLLKPALVFFASLFLSLLFAPFANPNLDLNQFFYGSLYLARFGLYAGLILAGPDTKKYLFWSFYFVPLIGLVQYFFLPDLRFLATINYDDHYYRLTFPFLDPGFTAATLVFIIFLSLGRLRHDQHKLLLALSVIALSLTFSRSGYLSFFIGLIYLGIRSPRRSQLLKPLFFLFLALFLLVIISPKPFGEGVNLTRTYSITSRLTSLQSGLEIFWQHPITGIGFNTLKYYLNSDLVSRAAASLPNSFIYVAVTAGLSGLSAFIYFLYQVFMFTRKKIFLQAAIVSLLFNSLSNNSFFYAPITILFFLTLSAVRDKTSP